MPKVLVNDTNLKNIGDAIRAKRGNTTKLKPSEMASAIRQINSGGFLNGEVSSIAFMNYQGSSLDLSQLDTSRIVNMNNMFSNCSNLTELNLSSFNTSKVTSMSSMFSKCSSLTELNLSSFNTSKVTDMMSMFFSCTNLTELNLSSFNTSNVTITQSMFYNCSSLTSLDLSSFNTSKVTDMNSMFNGCSSLTSLNLSSFNTSKVTSMSSMFSKCSSLNRLIIGKPTDTAPQNLKTSNAFSACPTTLKIYVPDHLINAYKGATNWSTYADRIVGQSEL